MVRALKRLAENYERMPGLEVVPGVTRHAALAAVLEGLHALPVFARARRESKKNEKIMRRDTRAQSQLNCLNLSLHGEPEPELEPLLWWLQVEERSSRAESQRNAAALQPAPHARAAAPFGGTVGLEGVYFCPSKGWLCPW
jgi:hypothetical protein